MLVVPRRREETVGLAGAFVDRESDDLTIVIDGRGGRQVPVSSAQTDLVRKNLHIILQLCLEPNELQTSCGWAGLALCCELRRVGNGSAVGLLPVG